MKENDLLKAYMFDVHRLEVALKIAVLTMTEHSSSHCSQRREGEKVTVLATSQAGLFILALCLVSWGGNLV